MAVPPPPAAAVAVAVVESTIVGSTSTVNQSAVTANAAVAVAAVSLSPRMADFMAPAAVFTTTMLTSFAHFDATFTAMSFMEPVIAISIALTDMVAAQLGISAGVPVCRGHQLPL